MRGSVALVVVACGIANAEPKVTADAKAEIAAIEKKVGGYDSLRCKVSSTLTMSRGEGASERITVDGLKTERRSGSAILMRFQARSTDTFTCAAEPCKARPAQTRVTTIVNDAKVQVQLVDGEKQARRIPAAKSKMLPFLDPARGYHDDSYAEVKLLKDDKVDGVLAHVLEASSPGSVTRTYYDAATQLPIRTVVTADDQSAEQTLACTVDPKLDDDEFVFVAPAGVTIEDK